MEDAWTCTRGDPLTPKDFQFELPQKCYGNCVPGESSTSDENLRTLKTERCDPPSGEIAHPCDLPCFKYDGDDNVPECTIRNGYHNPANLFNRNFDCYDCDKCVMANWKECMPIKKPKPDFQELYKRE